MAHPFNGMNVFGNGADGAGPVSGNLAAGAYNYTSWNITGAITLNTVGSEGTIFKVQGDVDITWEGSISLVVTDGDEIGATGWGSAGDGEVGGAGGAACGVSADRYETTVGQNFWDGWVEAGYGYSPAIGVWADHAAGKHKLIILAGGKITVGMDPGFGPRINGSGKVGSATGLGFDSGGGGGGGIICLISNVGIAFELAAANPADISHVISYGGNGGAGFAAEYGGGGGGGGAIILMAPSITGDEDITTPNSAHGGFGGASTNVGAGNGGGGGGSFGAGGAGGLAAHPSGYAGSDGAVYELLISSLPLFQ